jgi:hypothetical protein
MKKCYFNLDDMEQIIILIIIIQIYINVSGDRHWLHMLLEIQLPYDHDYDGPLISTQEKPTPVTAQIFCVPNM